MFPVFGGFSTRFVFGDFSVQKNVEKQANTEITECANTEKPPNIETTENEIAEKLRNTEITEDRAAEKQRNTGITEDAAAETDTKHRNHRKRSGQATELMTVPVFIS